MKAGKKCVGEASFKWVHVALPVLCECRNTVHIARVDCQMVVWPTHTVVSIADAMDKGHHLCWEKLELCLM